MKKQNLDETWELCLKMWKWIIKEWKKMEEGVPTLKSQWLKDNGFDDGEIDDDCFFCEYDATRTRSKDAPCAKCPAKRIDPKFRCGHENYDWCSQPDLFYKKLLALNRKRLKAKKHGGK